MAETTYPDLQIHDDWNERTPDPVTSLADDHAKAGNTPNPKAYSPDMVETSVGAVAPDSPHAKAAADVKMRDKPRTQQAAGRSAGTKAETKA